MRILRTLISMFWTSGDVFPGFKARVDSLVSTWQRRTFSKIHLWCDIFTNVYSYYRPQMKLREGNVYTPVCQSFCPLGGGGGGECMTGEHAWKGMCVAGEHAWQGECTAGGMHRRGCVWQGSMHCRGHAW